MKDQQVTPQMREMTLKISGFTKIILFNKDGFKFSQSLSPTGRFIVPSNFIGARFKAIKEDKDGKESEYYQGVISFG